MAEIVLTDVSVSIAGNDISDHVSSVNIQYGAETQDKTAMGDGTRERIGGLKDWSMAIELNADFANSAEDSILFPLVGTTVALVIKPTSAGVGTSNPSFSGNGVLETYPIIVGAVGDLAKNAISLVAAGTLARATS